VDIETLQTFVDLQETKSFSLSAERRSVTQSAVSQRIRSLEGELRTRLVDRAPGRAGVTLTTDGLHAATIAREMLALYDRLLTELSVTSRQSGARSLRVASVYSMGLHSFTGLFAQYLSTYPDVTLHVEYLRTDRIYVALRAGEIDCGIVACPRPRSGINVLELEPESMVVVCSPRHLLAQSPCAPEDLRFERFVSFDHKIPTRSLVDGWFQQMGVAPIVDGEFDNVETIKQKVELAGGLAVLPEPTVRRELAEGTLVRVRLNGPELWRPTGLLTPKTRLPSGPLLDFIRLIRPNEPRRT